MTLYTVTGRDGLLIVYGALPVDGALAMTQSMPRNSVFCTPLPKRTGANFVVGPPATGRDMGALATSAAHAPAV